MKKEIRDFFKKVKEISTIIGPIVLDENPIGEGGNSLVYKGVWKNNSVAVKFLAFEEQHKLNRFYDEISIQMFAGDERKGVGKILYFNGIDVGDFKVNFYVMPFHKLNLKSWRKRLSLEVIIEKTPSILRNLLSILNYLEERGIVHRDIKPENILVQDDEKLILIDFGIAWFKNDEIEKLSETSFGERIGNYAFSAPEQEHGALPDKRMDFYAVGQILQWLITGKTHRGTGRERFSSRSPLLTNIDPLVDDLLSNDPNRRPSSISDIKKFLEKENEYKDASKRANDGFNEILGLEKILRKSFPGENGLFQVREKNRIDFFLKHLSSQLEAIGLEWVGPEGSSKLTRIKKYNNFWLFDYDELLIDSIWVYRTGSPDREFFAVVTKPSEKFKDDEFNSDESGYASLYRGEYVSPRFSNDGYMIKNGKSVSLIGKCEDRYRHYKPTIRFFGAECSSIIFYQNEDKIAEGANRILKGEDPKEVMNNFRHLKTNPTISMLK